MKRSLLLWAVVLGLLFAISGALLWPREAQAQTAGLCGAGRPCSAMRFTASSPSGSAAFESSGSANSAAMCISNGSSPDSYGLHRASQYLRVMSHTSLANCRAQTGTIQLTVDANTSQVSATGSLAAGTFLKSTGVAITALPAAVVGQIETDTSTGTPWFSDASRWHSLRPRATGWGWQTFTASPGSTGNGALAGSWVYSPSPAVGATPTTIAQVANATGAYTGTGSNQRRGIMLQTTAVANNVASVLDSQASYNVNLAPRVEGFVATEALTNRRIWWGLPASPPSASDTLPNNSMAFRFSTSASDTQWQFCTKDGTTQSCTTTGVNVAANTEYALSIECAYGSLPPGTCWATVNGTTIAKTTNLPANASLVQFGATITTLTTATANLNVSAFSVSSM